MKKFGVNIDHVATVRNARGEGHPDIIEIAHAVKNSGAATRVTDPKVKNLS